MAIQKITSNVLADGAVSASNLEDGAVSASKLAAGSVSASSLGDNSVTEAKLADSSISTAKLADSSVSSAKLADNSVSSAKVVDSSISTAKLADSSVTSAKLADSGISTAKLADNSVTSSKLSNNSVGIDQLNLSDGTDGQILTTNGSGTLSFADAAGGGGVWNLISSQTLSSSVSSITFTGVTGYKVYKLIMTDVNHSVSGTTSQLHLSSDNGSTFATFGIRSIALRYNSGSTTQTFSNDFYQSNKLPLMYNFAEFSNDEKHHVEVTIFGLNDATAFTHLHSRLLTCWDASGTKMGANETYARTTSTGGKASFNAFKIDGMFGGSSTYDGGTFALYGLSTS